MERRGGGARCLAAPALPSLTASQVGRPYRCRATSAHLCHHEPVCLLQLSGAAPAAARPCRESCPCLTAPCLPAWRPTGVTGFADTNKVLALSRVMVAWQPVGLALGAYDMCARYLAQRRQFGAPLASFQLMQASRMGRARRS